ncbi:DNA-binding transcriptional LysR family regulator [Saccharothrix tamanrassetensis]|uniref:DNA-binding transcriptional LysR family regulator n=1 Tax=Saccharothrix tamanrassetensis TaxID=1051531 RepID=A0A841CMI6_9PSEU|nr:LysR family transcriptional regulator [Saccharothrix tamanrassetensis]MBB5957215.1 DNA-binding transcriptional LysR family regulator [Saccharothrix tamanrassetensis]
MLTVSLAGLRAIEALAIHGSMTAAASALGYTPSAISQQIARLSRDVHQQLVEHQAGRTTLTPAGRVLAESASRIVIELESMSAELQAHSETVTGTLTIAAFPTATRGVLPSATEDLTRTWSDLSLRLIEVDSHRAVELVARGTADLAVAHDWTAIPLTLPEGLQARHLGNDLSDVLAHHAHPLVGRTSVDLDELRAERWLYEPNSVAHDFLLNAFQHTPNPTRFTHIVSEYASQIELVGTGLGLALVPRMGRGPLPPSVRVLPVTSPPVRRIYGVWRTPTGRRPALTAALGVLEAVCARLEHDT